MVEHNTAEVCTSGSYRDQFTTAFHADRVASRQILDHGVQSRILNGLQSSACGTARCTMEAHHLCEELSVQRFWAANFVTRFPEHQREFEAMKMIQARPPGVQQLNCGSLGSCQASQETSSFTTNPTPFPPEGLAEDNTDAPLPLHVEDNSTCSGDDELPATPPSRAEPIPDLLTFATVDPETEETNGTAPAINHEAGEFPSKNMIHQKSKPRDESTKLVNVIGKREKKMLFDLPFDPIPEVPLKFAAQHEAGAFGDPAQSRTVIISNLPDRIDLGNILKQVRGGRVVKAILLNIANIAGMGDAAAMIYFDTTDAAQKFLALTAERPFGFTLADGNRVQASVTSSRVASHPFNSDVRHFLQEGHTRCLLFSQVNGSYLHRAVQTVCLGRPVNTIIADFKIVGPGEVIIAFTSVEMANACFRVLINIETRDCSFHAEVAHVDDPCNNPEVDVPQMPFITCVPLPQDLDELITMGEVHELPSTEREDEELTKAGGTPTLDPQMEELREIAKSAGIPWPEDPPRERTADREHSDQWHHWDGVNREGKDCRFEQDPLSGAVHFRLRDGSNLSEPIMYSEEFFKEWLHYNLDSEDPYIQESLDLYFAANDLLNLRKVNEYIKKRDEAAEKDAAV
ncbi:hypothetical protein ACHAQH_008236 [Verticillium albo-atrum]